jgi:hypothetical protein
MLGQHTRVRTATLGCIVASSPPVKTLTSSARLALRLSLVNPACKRRISHKPPHTMGRSLDLAKVDIEKIILPFKTYHNVVIAARSRSTPHSGSMWHRPGTEPLIDVDRAVLIATYH